MFDPTDLLAQDRDHLLHPLQHPQTHAAPLVIKSGTGIYLQTVDGRTIMDGLSALWNVLVGYGRVELAAAAQKQMTELAYCSNYAGLANLPAIELAERLAGYAYPDLKDRKSVV